MESQDTDLLRDTEMKTHKYSAVNACVQNVHH